MSGVRRSLARLVDSPPLPFWLYWRSFNWWPAIRGSGMRLTHVSPDWTEIDVKLPLNWRTRNYVGSIFGGSLYSALDPWFMVMILRQIGDGYVVWDKSARVYFKRPGTQTLYAKFRVSADEVAELKRTADEQNQFDRTFSIDLKDADGKVYATVDKVLFFARKDWYDERQKRRADRSAT